MDLHFSPLPNILAAKRPQPALTAQAPASRQALPSAASDTLSIRFGATPQAQVDAQIRDANKVFAKTMLSTVEDSATTQNTVLSPANTFLLLTLLSTGATGETRREINRVMGLPEGANKDQVIQGVKKSVADFAQLMEETGITLEQCFGVWIRQNAQWNNGFSQRLDELSAEKDHITTAEAINNWASSKTNGKITDIVKEEELAASLAVLASATYLLSNWRSAFKEARTQDKPFQGLNGTTTVPTMNQKADFPFSAENPKYDMVRMPYGQVSETGRELSMSLFLPKEGETLKSAYQALFRDGEIDAALQTLQEEYPRKLTLEVPKFTIETETNTKDALQQAGLNRVFSSNDAELKELVQDLDDMYVGVMKQKAFIDVNEKGTEAAAVDVGMIMRTSVMRENIMKFDRPFIGVIHDEQGRILFVSTVTDL